MKKLLFTLTFFCLAYYAQAQTGTTLEEYNYCTKGYKVQIESGLDMKRGYSIGQVQELPKYKTASVAFIELYRFGENPNEAGQLAATIMRVTTGTGTKYLCIPNKMADNELWLKYFNDFDNAYFSTTDKTGIIYATSLYFSKYKN
jgi:hypothetical protein